ncbi:MAG TPA: hypothetical protein PK680_00405 [Novosphingobium sp.]|nr:hypothetical protein [Novosphingobium sp.]HQA16818.1 hypothetical protein [Novosphingobium sp.]
MEAVLALADTLLDPAAAQWERMHAAQDLDQHGPAALPYLFEAASLDWSADPAMVKLIGNSIANIWRASGVLMSAPTAGLPQAAVDEIVLHRSHFSGEGS